MCEKLGIFLSDVGCGWASKCKYNMSILERENNAFKLEALWQKWKQLVKWGAGIVFAAYQSSFTLCEMGGMARRSGFALL